jgi:hypothetical protein
MSAEPRFCRVCGKELVRKQGRGEYDPRTGQPIPGAEYLYCPKMRGGWIEGHSNFMRVGNKWIDWTGVWEHMS